MNIYDALKTDHSELKEFLIELVNLEQDDDYRMILIEQIATSLIPHARAEESVFYNSIRAVSSDNSPVMHSYKEHLEAETLLRMLQVKDKVNFDWKATALKLQQSLEHHIQEEENRIFVEARKYFSNEEAEMMGDAFVKMKQKVAQEGFMKTSFDLVVNLMPPRFIEKLKGLSNPAP
jgi:hemerythrin-like domain-containing protein